MTQKTDIDSFIELGRNGVIIDVRTPAEFALGHIPGALNLPLFNNEERAVVGTIYKKTGHDAAVLRGLEAVGPKMADIVRQAMKLSQGGRILLYCWRGGMRSGSVGWLLETAGMKVTLLSGGYKAYRRSFDSVLEKKPWKFIMLSGATGCGKTELLERLAESGEQVLDLEGIAHHKGSAFGGLGKEPQPTTEHFINLLHERFRGFTPERPVWCEGESILVGKVFIPNNLFAMMRSGIIIEVGMDRDQRLDRLVSEYGCFAREQLAAAFNSITKRMGREQVAAALQALDSNDIRSAADLALDYYDKAYARTSTRKADITFIADGAGMECNTEKLIKIKDELTW